MKIKSLLAIAALSLSTSLGYADTIVPVDILPTDTTKLPESYQDQLNEIARTSAIISASSQAAALAIGTKEGYAHLESFAALSEHLHGLLDATLEGADGGSVMRIKRFLDVLVGLKKDAKQEKNSCITWMQQFDGDQAKELALALAIASIKEIVFQQADALLTSQIKGDGSKTRIIRRGAQVATAALIESSLDALQAKLKSKFIAPGDDWAKTFVETAVKVGVNVFVTQTTGELIRRSLDDKVQEIEALDEAVAEQTAEYVYPSEQTPSLDTASLV
jgi:hypothetical protein